MQALEDSLRRLRTSYIDLYQIHNIDTITPVEGTLLALDDAESYYSLVGRDIEAEIIPMLTEEKLGLLVYSSLAGGYHDRAYKVIDVLREVANRHSATVAQTALAWVLAQPAVTRVIVGARRPAQLTENLDAIDTELTAEDLEEPDTVSRNPLSYPGWMQADLNWRYPQSA